MDNYNNLKTEYIDIKDRFLESKTDITVLGKIKNDTERQSIIEFILTSSDKEEIENLLQSYELKYEEVMIEILNEKIIQDIKFIDELILQIDKIISLNGNYDEEVDGFKTLYVELASEIDKYFEFYNSVFRGKQSSNKQYQTGENVIAFFRKSEDSKFLIEEDIDSKCSTNNDAVQNRDFCLEKMFLAINSVPSYSFIQKRLNNCVTAITTGDYARNKSKQYLLKSNYSGIDCNFSRLKSPTTRSGVDNAFRASFLKITMPQENVDKIGAKSRMVLLIIGATDIKNHNKNSEYGDFINEYELYSEQIQKVIKMFEDPNTPQSELLKLLDDSSDLYNMFVGNIESKNK